MSASTDPGRVDLQRAGCQRQVSATTWKPELPLRLGINNALKKPSATAIELRLLSSNDTILLSVCDDGEPISPDIENSLFSKPVSSGSGMGIGLYQSAIMARAFNLELALSQHEHGRVCFNLFQHLGD